MGDATTNDGALVAKPGRGQAQVVVEFVQVGAADIAKLDMFEVAPDAFIWIEVGRVAGQLLEPQSFGGTLRQELLDRPSAMNRCAIPDHQHLTGQVTQQVAEELHHVWRAEGMILDLQQQTAARCDATDHRQMLTCDWKAQRGRMAAWGQAAHHSWQQREARFVYPDNPAALAESPLFSAGQRSVRHCSIAASLRWLARRSGFCGLQPAARSKLPT